GFILPQNSPLRMPADNAADTSNDPSAAQTAAAPSRIGHPQTYGVPAANGASVSGYDSLNRTRRKPKFYPGQPRPKPSPGPGTPAPIAAISPASSSARPLPAVPPSATANKAPIPPAMAGTVPGQPPRRRLKIDDDP